MWDKFTDAASAANLEQLGYRYKVLRYSKKVVWVLCSRGIKKKKRISRDKTLKLERTSGGTII